MRFKSLLKYHKKRNTQGPAKSCRCPQPMVEATAPWIGDFQVLAVYSRSVVARIFEGSTPIGTWKIDFQRRPGVLCQKNGRLYLFDMRGMPYPHPHVSPQGEICLGGAVLSLEELRTFSIPKLVLGALGMIDILSAYWIPKFDKEEEG